MFIILIILAIATKSSVSFKPDDFCNLVQTESIGFYDSLNNYHTKHVKVNCHGKYSHKCDKDKCATNKQGCSDYQNYVLSLNIYRNIDDLDKFTVLRPNSKKIYKNSISRLKNFNEKVPNCSKITYNWKSDDSSQCYLVFLIYRHLFVNKHIICLQTNQNYKRRLK